MVYNSDNMELDIEMASLQLNEEVQHTPSNEIVAEPSNKASNHVASRMLLRKRIRALESDKRRVCQKPRKLDVSDITSYYLDKTVKKAKSTLETVFEQPKLENGKELVMSIKKFKRIICFESNDDKGKVKKRRMKAKKVLPKKKTIKLPTEYIAQKLKDLEDGD